MSKRALITGITGQDGSYLAHLLLTKGYEVFGIVRKKHAAHGGLDRLHITDRVRLIERDLTDLGGLNEAMREILPHEIYHFAAQSSVQHSHEHPYETLHFNVSSSAALMEATHNIHPTAKLLFASSSEIYAATPSPITLASAYGQTSPYGISKLTSQLSLEHYRSHHGAFFVSAVLFPHESVLRDNRSFIKRTISTARRIANGSKEIIEVKNPSNQRDYGYAPSYVEACFLALQTDTPRDYIVCSGRSISLQEIITYVVDAFNLPPTVIQSEESTSPYFGPRVVVGDPTETKRALSWTYDKSFYDVLDEMIAFEIATAPS